MIWVQTTDNAKEVAFVDSGILHYALDFDISEDYNIKEIIDKELEQAIIFVWDNDIKYEKDNLRPNNQELNLIKSQNMIIEIYWNYILYRFSCL